MRRFLAALILAAVAGAAAAQSYPARPIRFIVPYPPGGGTDIVARAISGPLQESLGQPVVIENRPGASEIIGTEAVARAAPDGHTLLLMSNTMAINAALGQKLPYDADRELTPVTRLVNVPFVVLIHPSVPAATVRDLVTLSKAQPGRMNAAHIGIGTPHYLTMQWFRMVTGADLTAVPYKGAGPALAALAAGEVQVMFAGMGGATGQIKAGKMKALAVTSAARVASAPDLPTIAESGFPEIDMTAWYGVMVPAGTPPEIVARLNVEFQRALSSQEVRDRFASLGMEAAPMSASDFGRLIRSETDNWTKVVTTTGVKTDRP